MVDAFGAVSFRHFRGRWARARTERWVRDLIEQIRSGRLSVADDSPGHHVAFYQEPDATGQLKPLDAQLAAIELINLIRPTAAIAWYITFSALALHQYPHWRKQLQTANNDELGGLVFRRTTPVLSI